MTEMCPASVHGHHWHCTLHVSCTCPCPTPHDFRYGDFASRSGVTETTILRDPETASGHLPRCDHVSGTSAGARHSSHGPRVPAPFLPPSDCRPSGRADSGSDHAPAVMAGITRSLFRQTVRGPTRLHWQSFLLFIGDVIGVIAIFFLLFAGLFIGAIVE